MVVVDVDLDVDVDVFEFERKVGEGCLMHQNTMVIINTQDHTVDLVGFKINY